MACALEVRSPLLDHRLAEFVSSLPVRLKFNAFQGKLLFKKVALNFLPKSIVMRKKHGFTVPVGEWLRKELKNFGESALSEKQLKKYGFLDSHTISKMWGEHQQGYINRVDALWTSLVFQVWCQEKLG